MNNNMNNTINKLLEINRPIFINISGSYVLHKIMDNNNICHNWNYNDLDIYISINDNNFNTLICLDYIKEILVLLTQNTNNHKKIINRIMKKYAYTISKIVTKNYINKMLSDNEFNNEFDNGSNNDSDNESNNESDNYKLIANNIIDVIKLQIDNINIDFIFIDIEISKYINNNFDLSIIQNYINNTNQIIQLNNSHDIKYYVSNFNLEVFNKILCCNIKVTRFIERIIKYNKRDFKIYLNYLNCLCNKINCLCSLKLDNNFINIFNQGCINFYNIYYNYYKCTQNKNHHGICYHYLHPSYDSNLLVDYMCNNEISDLNHNLQINKYNSEAVMKYYYADSIVYSTIIKKIILLRDLTITYSLHPNNLLKIYDDLLE